MTDIWRKDGEKWSLARPSGFPSEEELHDRIVEAPEMLPLSGQPQLAVVGREVGLGNGSADVLAVEPSGRPVIIEVKLSRNAEARRAVVAQVLAYAAYLHRRTVSDLENILRSHLDQRGHKDLAGAAAEASEGGTFDSERFYDALAEHLAEGSFRIVVVLDAAPRELVRLTGYLEAITTDRIVVDLVTVSAYEVNGAQILLPQRIDPERAAEPARLGTGHRTPSSGVLTEGSERFRESIHDVPDEEQAARLRRLADWGDAIGAEGLCRPQSFEGTAETTNLLLRLPTENAGFAYASNSSGNARLYLYRSVIERHAPGMFDTIETAAETKIGKGTRPKAITPALLDALTEAYREAAGKE